MSNNARPRINLKLMVIVALLTAVQIVISRLFSISLWNLKIGFGFVPVMLAGIFFGPLAGGLVGGLSDLIGALLFPIGPYFPGFTLTAALSGAMFGWVLHKRHSFARVCGVVLFNQLVLGLLVNSFWISVLYGSPYFGLLLSRLVQYAILVPVEVIVTWLLLRVLSPLKHQINWNY